MTEKHLTASFLKEQFCQEDGFFFSPHPMISFCLLGYKNTAGDIKQSLRTHHSKSSSPFSIEEKAVRMLNQEWDDGDGLTESGPSYLGAGIRQLQ